MLYFPPKTGWKHTSWYNVDDLHHCSHGDYDMTRDDTILFSEESCVCVRSRAFLRFFFYKLIKKRPNICFLLSVIMVNRYRDLLTSRLFKSTRNQGVHKGAPPLFPTPRYQAQAQLPASHHRHVRCGCHGNN